MTHTYPRTIDTGSGETLTFLRLVSTPQGNRLEVEGYAEPGVGVPMHIHHLQEEAFTVLEGRMGVQVGDGPEQFLGPGETIVCAAGVPHRWWNAGPGRLHSAGWVVPADNFEYFLSAVFDSTKRSGGKRPALFDVAFLATRYQSEFGMQGVPAVMKSVVFPIVVAIGRLLGKYRRYEAAPEPVHRSPGQLGETDFVLAASK